VEPGAAPALENSHRLFHRIEAELLLVQEELVLHRSMAARIFFGAP
jgi:hypothetical protein